MRTGNIDFYASALESSSPQPLRLLVEETRVTEGAVGQDIAELRWRLATLEEGKELVVLLECQADRTSLLALTPLLGGDGVSAGPLYHSSAFRSNGPKAAKSSAWCDTHRSGRSRCS